MILQAIHVSLPANFIKNGVSLAFIEIYNVKIMRLQRHFCKKRFLFKMFAVGNYKVKKKQATFSRNILVTALAVMYFFMASAHIFFIPCLTQNANHAPLSHSIVKRSSEFRAVTANHQSFFQRPDKSIFEERKMVQESIKTFLSFFTILLLIPLVWRIKPTWLTCVANHQSLSFYSYLSLCVIRI